MPVPVRSGRVRFGAFEVDLRTRELFKFGNRVRLQDQSFRILALLLEHPGEMVSREELRQQLWPADTFVDFDTGMNTAIKRLRDALNDSADAPKFIETLPRRGYRFIGTVDPVERPPDAAHERPESPPPPKPAATPRHARLAVAVLLTIVLLGLTALAWRYRRHSSGQGQIHSLVVLPFDNLSPDRGDDYLADGLTTEVINRIAPSIFVPSRTTAMTYRGQHKKLPEIARELDVDAVLESTVQRSGDRIHITARLVDGRNEATLWRQSYERQMNDLLTVESDIARDLAQEIHLQLSAAASSPSGVSPRRNEAHRLYLKGMDYWWQLTPEAFERCREYFEQAIEIDPSYSRGYTGMAYYYGIMEDHGLMPPKEAWTKAKEYALKALELDPNNAEAHLSLAASYLLYEWDWNAAGAEDARALQLNGGNSEFQRDYSVYLRTVGRMNDALRTIDRAQQLDPRSAGMAVTAGWTYYYARRYADALARFQRALALDATSIAAHEGVAKTKWQMGDESAAITEFEKELSLSGNQEFAVELQRTATAQGSQAAYRMLVKTAYDSARSESSTHYVSPMLLASAAALAGNRDAAFSWLDQAYQERSGKLLDIRIDPDFDALRSDPRFEQLVHKIGLP